MSKKPKKKKSEKDQPWLPLLIKGVVCNNTQFPDHVVPLAVDMSNELVKVTLALPRDLTSGDKMDVVDFFILGENRSKCSHRHTITLAGDDRDYILGVRWVPKEGQTYYQIKRDMTVEKVTCQILYDEKHCFECGNCFATEDEALRVVSYFRDVLAHGVF